MLLLNINGAINSGKSTVSKILMNLLLDATCIESGHLWQMDTPILLAQQLSVPETKKKNTPKR